MLIDSKEDYDKLQAVIEVVTELLDLKSDDVFDAFESKDMYTWTQFENKVKEYHDLIFKEG